jgi:hypothetical protein
MKEDEKNSDGWEIELQIKSIFWRETEVLGEETLIFDSNNTTKHIIKGRKGYPAPKE